MAIADSSTTRPTMAGRAKTGRPGGKRSDSRTALNMRIQPDLRELIDWAAEATGKNRTDFVLDAARQAAQATLLDQVHVQLNAEAYAAFMQRLDAPPEANERLRKTMRTAPVWG